MRPAGGGLTHVSIVAWATDVAFHCTGFCPKQNAGLLGGSVEHFDRKLVDAIHSMFLACDDDVRVDLTNTLHVCAGIERDCPRPATGVRPPVAVADQKRSDLSHSGLSVACDFEGTYPSRRVMKKVVHRTLSPTTVVDPRGCSSDCTDRCCCPGLLRGLRHRGRLLITTWVCSRY